MYQNKRRQNQNYAKKKKTPRWPFFLLGLAVLIVLVLAGAYLAVGRKSGNEQTVAGYEAPAKSSFNKSKYSTSDPDSIWVVVNKQRPLNPKNYAPPSLTTPDMNATNVEQVNSKTAEALKSMSDHAAAEGIKLTLVSGYRSYDTQVAVYGSEVKAYGQAQADRESARPGYSEHQSGWSADLGADNGKCRLQACFADTPEGKWLKANAYKYGFLLRYVEGKEQVTGYQAEPWHYRYIGTELSNEMHRSGTQTLEEFFGLPAAPSY